MKKTRTDDAAKPDDVRSSADDGQRTRQRLLSAAYAARCGVKMLSFHADDERSAAERVRRMELDISDPGKVAEVFRFGRWSRNDRR